MWDGMGVNDPWNLWLGWVSNDRAVLDIGGRRQAMELRQGKTEHIPDPVHARLLHARQYTVKIPVL